MDTAHVVDEVNGVLLKESNQVDGMKLGSTFVQSTHRSRVDIAFTLHANHCQAMWLIHRTSSSESITPFHPAAWKGDGTTTTHQPSAAHSPARIVEAESITPIQSWFVR